MKKFTKILLAVATVFAVSCTTDVTEDLGVQLGNAAQTVIDLSLEESRTHINGKEGETYPLYWSAGDKIAVNGVASEALTEAAHGKAKATFTLSGELTYPYNIVYPAPAEGVVAGKGLQAVTFLATQDYTAGSFAEGAVPMYAYVENAGNAISLEHLAGVLRFVPKGDTTLKSVVVSVEEGKIAGNFDIDCANGTLTAQADATNTVVVSLGEGLALNAEGTPIYVAVPAGDYGVVNVTFYTATDSMSTSFTTEGEKAVKAGIIREFPAFDYKANNTSDEFVIYDEVSLRSFAANVDKFGAEATYKSAKVIADIDMTGKTWTPIDNNTEFVLDGSNCAIKGLTAPLFDTTMTSIKNLRLVDVNIVEKENHVVGALARKVVSENAVVENCSVSGKIEVAYENPEAETNTYIGGIVGVSSSTKEFSNLVNSANIEISGKVGYTLYCSGIVCHAKSGALTNVTNLGNIDFTGESANSLRLSGITFICPKLTNCVNGSADAKQVKGAITVSGTLTGGLYIGALLPELNALRGTINVSNCYNYGALTINSTSTLSSIQSGGLFGYNSNNARTVNATNCHNYGNITVTSNTKGNVRVGGLNGNITGSTYVFTECSNHGKLSYNASSGGEIRVAGLVGALGDGGDAKIVNGYTNYGNIEIGENTNCTGTNVQIGGVVANYSGAFNDASSGIIKNAGNISYKESASNTKISRVGGIIAAANKAFNFDNASLVNEGNITAVGGNTDHDLTVGGIYGNSSKAINNARCYCNIVTTNASVVGMIMAGDYKISYPVTTSHIGGGISKSGGEPTPITLDNYPKYVYSNAPDEKVVVNSQKNGWLASKDAEPELKFIAGTTISSFDELLAWATAETTATSADNVELTTDIVLPEGTAWTPIEGYAGTFNGNEHSISGLTAPLFGTTQASITNLKLTNVNIEFTEAKGEYAALACKIDNASAFVKNCSVSGNMKINLDMTETITTGNHGDDNDIDIAGVVAITTSTQAFSNLTNNVNIEIGGTIKNNLVVAGILTVGKTCKLTNSTNLGTITYNGSSSKHLFVGGLISECKEVVDCTNGSADDKTYTKGSMVHDGKAKNVYLTGFTSSIRSNVSFIRCHNYGSVTYTANAETGGATMPSGGIGNCSTSSASVVLDSCSNSAPITVNAKYIGGDLKVGGMVSHYGSSNSITVLNGYTNNGTITVAQIETKAGAKVQIGGMIGNFSSTWKDDSTGRLINKGDVTYSGTASETSTVRIGGILAAMAANPKDNLQLVNTGALTSEGTGQSIYLGGILGAGKKVSNAICYCDIKIKSATSYGWIMAAPRSSTLFATNCAIGGRLMEWYDEDGIYIPSTIKEDEYFNFIYSSGSSTDWTGTDNYDGCTYLSAMPTL